MINGTALVTEDPCHVCGNHGRDKVSFQDKPLCLDWHACARTLRRKQRSRKVYRTSDGCFATAGTPGAQLSVAA